MAAGDHLLAHLPFPLPFYSYFCVFYFLIYSKIKYRSKFEQFYCTEVWNSRHRHYWTVCLIARFIMSNEYIWTFSRIESLLSLKWYILPCPHHTDLNTHLHKSEGSPPITNGSHIPGPPQPGIVASGPGRPTVIGNPAVTIQESLISQCLYFKLGSEKKETSILHGRSLNESSL